MGNCKTGITSLTQKANKGQSFGQKKANKGQSFGQKRQTKDSILAKKSKKGQYFGQKDKQRIVFWPKRQDKDKDLTDGGGGQMASIRKQREVYYCLGGKQSSLSAAFLIARKTVFFPITILPSEAFEG